MLFQKVTKYVDEYKYFFTETYTPWNLRLQKELFIFETEFNILTSTVEILETYQVLHSFLTISESDFNITSGAIGSSLST